MIVYFGRRRFRSGWFHQVSHSIYIRTVRPLLLFSFGTFDSSGMVWADIKSTVHVALSKRPIHGSIQFFKAADRR